jgi:predicted nucleotidyltransferase
MRLQPHEITSIQKSVKKYFGESQIYLFGSRLKQEVKGGDIDIFIIPQNRDNLAQKSAKVKFWLEESLFKPVDIVVHQNFEKEIEKEALKGIKI